MCKYYYQTLPLLSPPARLCSDAARAAWDHRNLITTSHDHDLVGKVIPSGRIKRETVLFDMVNLLTPRARGRIRSNSPKI
jgi:hypothetical protein